MYSNHSRTLTFVTCAFYVCCSLINLGLLLTALFVGSATLCLSLFLTLVCSARFSFGFLDSYLFAGRESLFCILIFSGGSLLAVSWACFKASSALFLFVLQQMHTLVVLSTIFLSITFLHQLPCLVYFCIFTSDSETIFLVSDWLTVVLFDCLFVTSSAWTWPLKATIAVATPK